MYFSPSALPGPVVATLNLGSIASYQHSGLLVEHVCIHSEKRKEKLIRLDSGRCDYLNRFITTKKVKATNKSLIFVKNPKWANWLNHVFPS